MARTRVLEVVERDLKKKANVWRREGIIPAEVYGPGIETNRHIGVNSRNFESIVSTVKETTLVTLKDESGNEVDAFVKTLQRHKVSDKVIHIDFYVPVKGHKMHLHIPINFVGECIGLSRGGRLEISYHELPVEILPKDIVETIDVDITNLNVHDHITAADIAKLLPEETKITLDPEDLVVSVVPKVIEEETEEETEEEV